LYYKTNRGAVEDHPGNELIMQRSNPSVWLLPLRLVIGFGFAAHGYAKLSRGPANFGSILNAIGVPAPNLFAWATSLIELIGGFSIMVGAFVTPVSVPLSLIMLTAMLEVHLPYGFSSIRLKAINASGAEFGPVGYEINLLYIAGLIALALGKPSKLSLDYWIRQKNREAEQAELVND
jgi:putative oxidoreductase